MRIRYIFLIGQKLMQISNKNNIEKPSTYSKNLFKYGLKAICIALVIQSNAYADRLPVDMNEQKICREKLNKINPNDKKFKYIEKMYKKSSSFGIHGHSMYIGSYPSDEGITKVKKKLTKDDIPYIVYDVTRMNDDTKLYKRVAARRLLEQFGLEALPCIRAVTDNYHEVNGICEGCYMLTTAEIEISVNEK